MFLIRIFSIKDSISTSEREPTPEPTPESTLEPAPELTPELASNPRVSDTPKTKRKTLSLKFRQSLLNEIKNEEKDVNNQIFKEYFHYQTPSILKKNLCEAYQIKKEIIVKHLNKSFIDLRNTANSKEIPANENPNQIINFQKKSSTSANNKKIEDSKY